MRTVLTVQWPPGHHHLKDCLSGPGRDHGAVLARCILVHGEEDTVAARTALHGMPQGQVPSHGGQTCAPPRAWGADLSPGAGHLFAHTSPKQGWSTGAGRPTVSLPQASRCWDAALWAGLLPRKERQARPEQCLHARAPASLPPSLPSLLASSLLAPLPSLGGELREFALESHMLGPKLVPLVTFIPHPPGCLRIRWRRA